VFCDLLGLWSVKGHIAAGKSHKGELKLGLKVLQLCGFEICHGVGAKLNARKPDCRNIVDRLALFVAQVMAV
jgi:hypothetical protein